MKAKRSYTMGARARSVEDTRLRILDAIIDLSARRVLSEISLDDVAAGAGVSVQTVLRQFGTRDGLIEAAMERATSAVGEERRAPDGDIDAALRILLDHYELRGEAVLLMLAQEDRDPHMAKITETGRRMHRAWVTDVFAPYDGDEQTIDLLVVATDVYTWKLLRRDRGLSRALTERRMKNLVTSVLAANDH